MTSCHFCMQLPCYHHYFLIKKSSSIHTAAAETGYIVPVVGNGQPDQKNIFLGFAAKLQIIVLSNKISKFELSISRGHVISQYESQLFHFSQNFHFLFLHALCSLSSFSVLLLKYIVLYDCRTGRESIKYVQSSTIVFVPHWDWELLDLKHVRIAQSCWSKWQKLATYPTPNQTTASSTVSRITRKLIYRIFIVYCPESGRQACVTCKT